MFLTLAKAAVMGGLFVVFLPVIGYVLVMKGILDKCLEWGKALASTVAGPTLAVGAAHLTGAPTADKAEPQAPVDARLDDLAKEIENARK